MTEKEILSKIVPESIYQDFLIIFKRKNDIIQTLKDEENTTSDIEENFPSLGELTYLDFSNIVEEKDRVIRQLMDKNTIGKLNYELGDILNDLSEWMNQTSLCPDPECENTFEYLFKLTSSIKSFTEALKNYELVKKN